MATYEVDEVQAIKEAAEKLLKTTSAAFDYTD